LDKVDPRSLAIVGHVFIETLPALEKKFPERRQRRSLIGQVSINRFARRVSTVFPPTRSDGHAFSAGLQASGFDPTIAGSLATFDAKLEVSITSPVTHLPGMWIGHGQTEGWG
jgi:hypothetical protein